MALALVSSAFLIILSVTGVILAYDAIAEKITYKQWLKRLIKRRPNIIFIESNNKYIII